MPLADETVQINGYGAARQLTLFEDGAPVLQVLQVLTSDTTATGAARATADGGAAGMSKRLTTTRRVAELLPALDAAFPTDLLPVVRSFLAAAAGADDDLLVLRRLPVDMTGGVVESMLVDDSPAGRAFITQETITAVTDDSVPRLRPDQRAGRAPRCARRRAGPDRLTPTHWRL